MKEKNKIYTIVFDETNKIDEKDVIWYFRKYFTVKELNHICFIRRYSSDKIWLAKFDNSIEITGNTLKELILKILSSDALVNYLLEGQLK